MAYASASGRSAGRMVLVAILAVIAILAVVVGVIYFIEPAKSLPSVLGTITSPASRATAHRSTRGAVAVGVGVVCLVAAAIAAFASRKGESAA